MTTLEKLSNIITTPPRFRSNTIPLKLLAEAKAEIERLEIKVTIQRFALEEICEVSKREGYTDKDRAVCSGRIAQEALSK